MNQDLIDMAEKCGLLGKDPYLGGMYSNALKAFAKLVAAAEREACAELCEGTQQEHEAYTGQPKALNYTCAAAIRERGETK